MNRDPLRGKLVENLFVLELIKTRFNQGLDPQLYFYRDAHGREVDLIFQSARKLIPIAIKASKTFNKDFLKNLKFFQTLAGDRFDKGYVIYAASEEQGMGPFEVINYSHSYQVETASIIHFARLKFIFFASIVLSYFESSL